MEVIFNEEGIPSRYSSGIYAHWFVQNIVSELESGARTREIVVKYGIKPSTLREWVVNYASTAYKDKIKPVAPMVKTSVVRGVLAGRMTLQEAKLACNIANTNHQNMD